MNECVTLLGQYKDIGGLLVVLIGGVFALWRWTIDQRWKRVQYTYQLVKEFMAKESTKKALAMLDTTNEIEIFPNKENRDDRFYYVEDDLILRALSIDDGLTGFSPQEFAVRMIFDEFFTDLSMFQNHIEAKLIRLEDVQPYLEYWIKSINGHGVVKGDLLASQIDKFLRTFDYRAVLQLSRSMNFSFTPSTV